NDIEIADFDGSGLRRVVVLPNSTDPADANAVFTAVGVSPDPSAVSGPRDGLLKSVSNGAGITTDLSYIRSTDIPTPVWVVNQIHTQNGLVGSGSVDALRQYRFELPIYDPRERAFMGYARVTEALVGSADSPGTVTTTTFATT